MSDRPSPEAGAAPAVPAPPPVRREVLPTGAVRLTFVDAIADETGPKDSLVVRRPTIGEQMELGDPLIWLVDDKASMPMINREMMLRYCSLLISGHDWDFIRRATNPALGIAIEETILGFFRSARISLTA